MHEAFEFKAAQESEWSVSLDSLKLPKDPSSKETTAPSILREFFSRRLPDYFEHLDPSFTVESFEGAGCSGCFFRITEPEHPGYFLKIWSGNEIGTYSQETSSKAQACERLLHDHGIPHARIFSSKLILPQDLPAELDGLAIGTIRGLTKPVILELQEFVAGFGGKITFSLPIAMPEPLNNS